MLAALSVCNLMIYIWRRGKIGISSGLISSYG